jgi:hypothetical protein
MEGTDLTCPKCGTTWKLIKAGDGPIRCPNCKAVVGPGPTAASPAGPQPVPPVTGPAAAPVTASTAPAIPRPAPDLTDADDPGIGAAPAGRMPDLTPPRRGRHPLVTVATILLLLLLVPLALCSVLFAVCTFMFRG